MISAALSTIGKDLQRAASRRDYAGVQRLAASAGTAAAEEARATGNTAEIAEWWRDLFARTEILLRIARAAQAEELRQVALLKRYLSRPEVRAARVAVSY
jgi:hypothetical protein